MWRKTLLAVAISTAVLSAQVEPRSSIHPEDMDPTCKPCDDFWRYANGGWLDKNPIPPRMSTWGPFPVLTDANRERMRSLLEAAAVDRAAPAGSTRKKMGDLYASCMDTAAIDSRGSAPLQSDFDSIAAIRTQQDLAKVLTRFQQIASPADISNLGLAIGAFRLSPRLDPKDPSRVIAQIDEHDGAGGAGTSIFSLPDRDYYFKDDPKSKEIRDAFLKHVATLLALTGATPEAAAAQATRVLAFETTLAQSAMSSADRRDPDRTTHLMDAASVTALTPNFDWKRFLHDLDLPESTPINVAQPEILKKFNEMLASVPLDDWKLWLRWRVLKVSAPYLSKPIFDEEFHFSRVILAGVQEQLPRAQTCVQVIDRDMGDALGEVYVARYFPPEARQRMSTMVANLRAAMREELQHADWLEAQTRQSAIKKLDAVTVKIGSTDRWRDYATLTVNRREYFENVRAAWQHAERYRLTKIGKPVDRVDWNMTAPTVNAYSSAAAVEVVFSAGILQPPFFDLTADDAENYGAIGAVIGHEMGHQFDDSGSKFDSTGMLNNWWTATDRATFDSRANCVVEQFNGIDVGDGLHHNGKLVLGEALGDLGGVAIALKAYQHSLAGKPAPTIDGFTGEQRFFIAFARTWGVNSRPEATRLQLATNPHPLPKYRAIATLQNIPEFHRAFMCKVGDPMVRPPGQQCKLW
jgi:putative endopeptidase